MLRATQGHYGGSAEKYSDRLTVLDFGPQAGGPHVWGPMCSTSALFILQAIGTALVLDAVARRIHKIE